MSTNSEIERIRRVYRDYERDTARMNRWSQESLGAKAIIGERNDALKRMLRTEGVASLGDMRILEIGCGVGNNLRDMTGLGAKPENLYGVDILGDRIRKAKEQYPAMTFAELNAEHLDFPDSHFDFVLAFVLFSSILSREMSENVAAEVRRVLKPDGYVIWYDFHVDNPSNEHVRGIKRADIQALFPGYAIQARTVTLLPPLANRLGAATNILYPLMAAIPFLRTHTMALIRKPGRENHT
jgi:SAM-dependent methyltransferase